MEVAAQTEESVTLTMEDYDDEQNLELVVDRERQSDQHAVQQYTKL